MAPPQPNTCVLRGTIAYAVAAISHRMIGFLLLPWYRRVVSPAECGQIGVLNAIMAALGTLGIGLETAVSRSAGRPAIRLNRVQERFRHSVLNKLLNGTYRLEDVPHCLCGSDKSVPIAQQDRFGVRVGVVACLNCGLARTSPRLAAEILPRFYQDDYHGLHMGVPEPDASISLFREGQGAIIYAQVAEFLPPTFRVAEIGCGTGQVLREFLQAAAQDGRIGQGIGCEYARAYVRAGRSTGSDIREGGPEVLHDAGPFDLVILSHVLEHFADVAGGLELISSFTHERGYLYVEVPGVLSVHRKPDYDFEFLHYLTLAHTYHFCLDTLIDVMHRSGFDLVGGDEEIRSVFRPAQQSTERRVSRGPGHLLSYLSWLSTSKTMRARRIGLRTRRSVRAAVRETLRVMLRPKMYRAVRGGARRLRIIR